MTPAEVLRRARSLLEERGWTQRELEDRAGRICAVGALNVACNLACYPAGNQSRLLDRDLAHAWLREVINPSVSKRAVADWNDDEDRTVVQVLMAFDKAIELAEGRA